MLNATFLVWDQTTQGHRNSRDKGNQHQRNEKYDCLIFEDDCYADLLWEGDRPSAIRAQVPYASLKR